MNCEQIKGVLGAYLDRELGPVDEASLARHLQECAACRAESEALRSLGSLLKSQPRHLAPASLRSRIESALPDAARGGQRPTSLGWFVFGCACASIAWLTFGVLRREPPAIASELLASHVRSLMPGHLIDIASSNRHTVKPWFAGKVSVAPAATDLTPEGFVLLGGRLDFISDRPTAVLVYRHKEHLINLFVLPKADGGALTNEDRQGFHLLTWPRGDLEYVAISDMDLDELQRFATEYQNH